MWKKNESNKDRNLIANTAWTQPCERSFLEEYYCFLLDESIEKKLNTELPCNDIYDRSYDRRVKIEGDKMYPEGKLKDFTDNYFLTRKLTR